MAGVKLAVEAPGHHWPEKPDPRLRLAPEEEPITEVPPLLFAGYALRFVVSLSMIDERTRHEYESHGVAG